MMNSSIEILDLILDKPLDEITTEDLQLLVGIQEKADDFVSSPKSGDYIVADSNDPKGWTYKAEEEVLGSPQLVFHDPNSILRETKAALEEIKATSSKRPLSVQNGEQKDGRILIVFAKNDSQVKRWYKNTRLDKAKYLEAIAVYNPKDIVQFKHVDYICIEGHINNRALIHLAASGLIEYHNWHFVSEPKEGS